MRSGDRAAPHLRIPPVFSSGVTDNEVLIGMGSCRQALDLSRANRHGLIAGATGTGKTVTL